jgi:C2 domain
VIPKDSCPIWNESFDIIVADYASTIKITVKDSDMVRRPSKGSARCSCEGAVWLLLSLCTFAVCGTLTVPTVALQVGSVFLGKVGYSALLRHTGMQTIPFFQAALCSVTMHAAAITAAALFAMQFWGARGLVVSQLWHSSRAAYKAR